MLRITDLHDDAVFRFFWGRNSVFSQWYTAPFTVEGYEYVTAEHWMMAQKARLFGDELALQKILATTDPARAKQWGRRVRGFDEDKWREHRVEIVQRGNLHKFNAPGLRAKLLATAPAILVEASPYDTIWGIGVSVSDSRRFNPRTWRGRNLLGFILTDIRSEYEM